MRDNGVLKICYAEVILAPAAAPACTLLIRTTLFGPWLYTDACMHASFSNLSSPSAVTTYCVEHVDPATSAGWAAYTSCNGPEAAP